MMEFWGGLLIGAFIGANVGLLVACIIGGTRRKRAAIANDIGSGEFLRWVSEERNRPVA